MKALDATILNRLLDLVGDTLSLEVARKLAKVRFDNKVQSRIDALARKCNEGKLSDDERHAYISCTPSTLSPFCKPRHDLYSGEPRTHEQTRASNLGSRASQTPL